MNNDIIADFVPPPYLVVDFYDWLTESRLALLLIKDLNRMLDYLGLTVSQRQKKKLKVHNLNHVLVMAILQWKQFQLMFSGTIPLDLYMEWKNYYCKLCGLIYSISKVLSNVRLFSTRAPPRGMGVAQVANFQAPSVLPFSQLLKMDKSDFLVSPEFKKLDPCSIDNNAAVCSPLKSTSLSKSVVSEVALLKSSGIAYQSSDDPFYKVEPRKPLCVLMVDNQPINKEYFRSFHLPVKLQESQVVIIRVLPLNSVKQGHRWPLMSMLAVNEVFVKIKSSQDEESNKFHDSYLNITDKCKLGSNNTIMFTGYFPINRYCLLVQLMRKISVDEVLSCIKDKNTLTRSESIDLFKQQNPVQDDEECKELAKSVALLDPLMHSKIEEPGKSRFCEHLECFDLRNYLMLNEHIRTWTCPICSKDAPFESLVFDEYYADIIKSTPSGEMLVEIAPDGSLNSKIILCEKNDAAMNYISLLSEDDEDSLNEKHEAKQLPSIPPVKQQLYCSDDGFQQNPHRILLSHGSSLSTAYTPAINLQQQHNTQRSFVPANNSHHQPYHHITLLSNSHRFANNQHANYPNNDRYHFTPDLSRGSSAQHAILLDSDSE